MADRLPDKLPHGLTPDELRERFIARTENPADKSWISFEIPSPPSANNLFANVPGRGRVKTAEYKLWQKEAAWVALSQLPKPMPRCTGYSLVDIDIPPGPDIDNLKAICDLLQMGTGIGLIASDRLIIDYHVRRVGKGEPCMVRVRPALRGWE